MLICARSLISVCTNLIAQVSRIQGHEIRVVLYAHLDGDCRLYEADYVVYILMHLPLISQCFINKWLVQRRVSEWLVHRTRKRVLGVPSA